MGGLGLIPLSVIDGGWFRLGEGGGTSAGVAVFKYVAGLMMSERSWRAQSLGSGDGSMGCDGRFNEAQLVPERWEADQIECGCETGDSFVLLIN